MSNDSTSEKLSGQGRKRRKLAPKSHITERKNGKWRVDLRWTPPGKERDQTRPEFDTEADAAKWESRALRNIREGLDPFFEESETPVAEAKGSASVPDVLAFYEEEWGPEAEPSSFERMKVFRRRLEAKLGQLTIEALTFGKLLRYRRDRMSDPVRPGSKKTISGTTAKKELSHLRAACYYALKEEKIESSPFERFTRVDREKLFPDEPGDGRVLKFEEFEKILSFLPRQYHAALRFARALGLRKGEVCKLEWPSILGDRVRVEDETSKTGFREVPLTEKAKALLPGRFGSGLVFRSPNGNCLYASLGSAWDRARKKAGIPDARIHFLKHSKITELLDRGALPHDIAESLGSSPATIAKHYDKSKFKRATKAFERADQFVDDLTGRAESSTSQATTEMRAS